MLTSASTTTREEEPEASHDESVEAKERTVEEWKVGPRLLRLALTILSRGSCSSERVWVGRLSPPTLGRAGGQLRARPGWSLPEI